MKQKKSVPLRSGDTVAVLVASSPIDAEHMERGRQRLHELGLKCIDQAEPLAGCHYLSQDAQLRTERLLAFLGDEEVRAVWLARGGYGANLMLSCLAKASLPGRTLPVFGSSDGCYLLWYLLQHWQVSVFLAPMIYASMTDPDGYDEASLRWALFGEGRAPQVAGRADHEFSAAGRLHGGCLSMLSSLTGTPFMPRLAGTLLIVEDVNERPYRLERMVWQLAFGGRLKGVRAILFGQFPGCFLDEAEKAHFYGRMSELLAPLSIPFARDFPLGHARRMVTVPLGVPARLSARSGRALLTFTG